MADNARADGEYEDDTGGDLPWLEPTELEIEDRPALVSGRAVIIVGLAVIAIVAALWLFADTLGGGDIEVPEDGEIPLVEAADGPYRIEPRERGGLEVSESERMTSAVASGEDLPDEVAVEQVPEVAVPVVPPVGEPSDGPPQNLLPGANGEAEPEVAETPQRSEPEPAPETERDEPAATRPAALIQLGAFSSRARAEEVWETFAGRYRYLAPLDHVLQSVEVNDSTLVRLRARVPGGRAAAYDICNRLKLAGEQCVVV